MGYVLAVTWVAKPGEEQVVAEALRKMVPLKQAEPGCVHFEVADTAASTAAPTGSSPAG